MRLRHLAAALLLALAPAMALAQSTAMLEGTVSDPNGAVIPDAVVTLTNNATGIARTEKTDGGGHFSFAAVNVGEYTLLIQATGFGEYRNAGVRMTVAQVLDMPIKLTVSTLEVVEVNSGAIATVDTGTASIGRLISEKQIIDLPLNGRSWVQLGVLTPGVSQFQSFNSSQAGYEPSGIRINVNGSRDQSNRFLWDGVNANDIINRTPGGASGQNLGVDAIREFKILTGSYSAEYGGASGGILTAVTRSGTNDWHGSAFEFLRNNHMDALNYFAAPGSDNQFKRNQFGGSVGGPILKNKTFVFGSYEGFRERLQSTQVATVPDLAARSGVLPDGPVVISPNVQPFLNSPLFPLPNGAEIGGGFAQYNYSASQPTDDNFYLARVDQQISNNDSIFARYSITDSHANIPKLQVPSIFIAERIRNQYLTIQETHLFNTRWVGTFRFNFARTNTSARNTANFAVPDAMQVIPGDSDGVPPSMAFGTPTEYGSSRAIPLDFLQNLFAGRADIVYSRGKNTLKFGSNLERYQYNIFLQSRKSGQFNFAGLRSFLTGTPQVGLVFAGNLSTPAAVSDHYYRNIYTENYVNDDYKILSNLTLNIGVRYEPATVPTEKYNNAVRFNNFDPVNFSSYLIPQRQVSTPFDNQSWGAFAPRVGLVWDPFKDGKTSIRSGFGMYYDPLLFWYGLNYVVSAGIDLTVPAPAFPHILSGTLKTPPPFLSNLPLKFHPPYMSRWSLDFQSELPGNMLFTTGYVGGKGTHVNYFYVANSPIPDVLADGTLYFPAGRPRRNPSVGIALGIASNGNSWYHGWQTQLERRFNNGIGFHASYTLSKSLDLQSAMVSNDSAIGEAAEDSDPFDPGRDKGRASYDARHLFVGDVIYAPEFFKGATGFKRGMGKGWQLSGIVNARSGLPFTPGINGDWARIGPLLGGNSRPNWAPGRNPENTVRGGVTQYYDPTAFVHPLQGTFGSVGRNVLNGPNLVTADVAVSKTTRLRFLGPAGSFQLRLEAFNVANHPNFDLPNRLVFGGASPTEAPSGLAGRITNTTVPNRQLQVGLRIEF